MGIDVDCMKSGFQTGAILGGRYESLAPLNHGSFGMVFLAEDLVIGGLVAIKCLSKVTGTEVPTANTDDGTVELACHERLGQHSNLVNLIHSFETQAYTFLVLEYCSMGDLYEAIRLGRGPLETENVRECMLQLVCAVDYLHSKELYHRDIKPENIFLCHDGSMKLGDFGLATTDSWSHEACVGSDRYMAPEQYDPLDIGYSPAQADVWAIGICLLNVLFSRNPFVTPTESDKLFNDFARDSQSLFDIFPTMSQDTFNILVHAIAIDPSKRSLSAVRQALEQVISFTTDEDILDDFCTEAREVAPASANREPLRTPSISSPQVDQGGAFPWSKALHTSPQNRQLSAIPDTESYIEDLFPESEKDRNSWYSLAQNSSVTSGLDSNFNASFSSMVLQPPVPRITAKSKAFKVPSSLPARMTSLSSVFGKKYDAPPKSWSEIWDEDEEDEFVEHQAALAKRREHNGRTWSRESQKESPFPRSPWQNGAKPSTPQIAAQNPNFESELHQTTDALSEHEVFMFEEPASQQPPPSKRTTSDVIIPRKSSSSVFDKWAALGNRRRQYNQAPESLDERRRKEISNLVSWRSNFGFKVLSGYGGRDKGRNREDAFTKVRDWRRAAGTQIKAES